MRFDPKRFVKWDTVMSAVIRISRTIWSHRCRCVVFLVRGNTSRRWRRSKLNANVNDLDPDEHVMGRRRTRRRRTKVRRRLYFSSRMNEWMNWCVVIVVLLLLSRNNFNRIVCKRQSTEVASKGSYIWKRDSVLSRLSKESFVIWSDLFKSMIKSNSNGLFNRLASGANIVVVCLHHHRHRSFSLQLVGRY